MGIETAERPAKAKGTARTAPVFVDCDVHNAMHDGDELTAVDAGEIGAHKVRVDVGVGAIMGDVEADPGIRLGEGRSKRPSLDNHARATVGIVGGAHMVSAVLTNELVHGFSNCWRHG